MQFVYGFILGIGVFVALTFMFQKAFDKLLGRAAGMKIVVELRPINSPPKEEIIVMKGGMTFNVPQDFRDQDADRVRIALEKNIGDAIERKLKSDTSVFGA